MEIFLLDLLWTTTKIKNLKAGMRVVKYNSTEKPETEHTEFVGSILTSTHYFESTLANKAIFKSKRT